MKTFEERYTAWIDGQLTGPALTAFELELSRRASAGEARADKQQAERLRALLKGGLTAPAMTNTDFFNHQLSERLAADRAAGNRREPARPQRPRWFAWSFGQLAGAAAAFLFFAVALFYGLMPGNPAYQRDGAKVAKVMPMAVPGVVGTSTGNTPTPNVAPPTHDPSQPTLVAKLEPSDIQQVQVDEQVRGTTTATPLHFQKPDVNVIWISGMDYLPSVPDEAPASPADATAATPPAPPANAAATAQP